MKTRTRIATCLPVLLCAAALLAPAAHASVLRTETLAKSLCGGAGACADHWKVKCANPQTHRVSARVRKTDPAANGVYEVTTLGYAGASIKGQADREISKDDGSFSIPAFVTRPGVSHGSTKVLVVVGWLAGKNQSSYDVEFSCSDIYTATETGKPSVKLVQDH
jgi:hypothetical protein